MNLLAEYRLRSSLDEMRQVPEWIESFAIKAGLSPAARTAFDHALVEWVTNVISYAFEDSKEHWIDIRFFTSPGQARVEVEDEGRPFNPLTRPRVDMSLPLELRPVGGLGIHMIREFMDSVEYRRAGNRNILTMTRRVH